MHFDHLDESFAMVKSNLIFDKVTLTDQTFFCIPVYTICQFWSSTVGPARAREKADRKRHLGCVEQTC